MIARTVLGTIRRHAMARPGDRLLVAVSGGPDSVALLHVLRDLASDLSLELAIAHLDHALRGRDAEDDRDFVAALASGLGLPFFAAREDVAALARRAKRSIEDAGRVARREFLSLAAARAGARRVALGHHRDDQAESVLMRLVSGSGRGGLSGIRPVSASLFIRPLLDCSRAEILEYLQARSIPYRLDATNDDPRFVRNRIRRTVMPLLREQINPRAAEAIARTAKVLRDEDLYLDRRARRLLLAAAAPADLAAAGPTHIAAAAAADIAATSMTAAGPPGACPGGRLALNAAAIASAPRAIARRALRLALRRAGLSGRGLSFDRIEEILALAGRTGSNAECWPGGGLAIRIEYGRLLIEKAGSPIGPPGGARAGVLSNGSLDPLAGNHSERPASPPIPQIAELLVPGEIEVGGRSGAVRIRARIVPRGEVEDKIRSVSPWVAHLDADRLVGPVLVRSPRPGDRIRPLGSRGSRKLSDLFTDLKVPRRERRDWLIVDAGGEIAWVVGLRVGDPFRVSGSTRRIAVLDAERFSLGAATTSRDAPTTCRDTATSRRDAATTCRDAATTSEDVATTRPDAAATPCDAGAAGADAGATLREPSTSRPPAAPAPSGADGEAPAPAGAGMVLYGADEIATAVDRLAGEVSRWAAGDEILVLGVLQGSFVFLADLARRLECPTRIGFLDRRGEPVSPGLEVAGARVLLVEDILDTGESLIAIVERVRACTPAEIRTCVLFDKPSGRKVACEADLRGLVVPDRWVVGYGLDRDGRHRNLPYLSWV